ncbi:hypothetical protein ACX0G9_24185 [Flavitalea flava]
MNTKVLYRFATLTALVGLIFACNKNNGKDNGDSASLTTAALQTQSDDQSRVSGENDAVSNDVETSLNSPGVGSTIGTGYSSGIQTSGAVSVASLICDASVTVDTTVNPKVITITYNGTNCAGNRTRTGVVTISIPAGVHWRDTGAVVTVNIQNLKITRVSDNKSITLNGTHIYTNVYGGRLIDLAKRENITETITSDNMSITFDDGTKRAWQVARKRVYTYNNGIVITLTGTHSDGTATGIEQWGINRFGNNFETLITQPLISRQDCSFRLTAGQMEIVRPEITATLTFGLDSAGAPTGCPGEGTYYFKASWEGSGGKSGSVILPY